MSNFNFLNLTDSVREKIISEIERDIDNETLYISSRLTEEGQTLYFNLLKEAVINEDDSSFTDSLMDLIKETEIVNDKVKKVPKNAASLIAQSEFNRFYIRGVCLEAINSGIEKVIIYRGRESSWARSSSEEKIGQEIDPRNLLEDLRMSIGKSPDILPEINSGLTVKLP